MEYFANTFDLWGGPHQRQTFPTLIWFPMDHLGAVTDVIGLDFSSAAAISNLSLCSSTGEHKDQKGSIKLKYHFSRTHAFQKKTQNLEKQNEY